jgi:hypothetical protein
MEVTPMHLITAYFQHAYEMSDAEPVWSEEPRDGDEASLRLDVDNPDASYRSDISTIRLDIIEMLRNINALACPSARTSLPPTC